MRVRKNVYTLPAGDDTVVWYAQAVKAMKALPRSNSRSWDYQSAVHGIGQVPAAQQDYWAKCQHGTSFFLPWHRMYLLHFERTVASHVVALGGPADWALPYWDYSASSPWRILPPAFRGATLADGSANPLFVADRVARANAGQQFMQDRDVDLVPAMSAAGNTAPTGFFGGRNAGHFAGVFGALEGTIHNTIHVRIGGNTGWMSDPDRAALDPIFWLHHCNVDRLWEVWLARDPAHRNLTTAYWLNGVSFDFRDAAGASVSMRTIDVLDLTAAALDYSYEDITDPIALPGIAAGGAPPPPVAVPAPEQNELAGATTAAVTLDNQVKHISVPTPVTPEAFAAAGAPPGLAPPAGPPSQLVQQVTLQLEHVTSSAQAPTYDVYVQVPDADDPSAHEDRFVGRAAMFGIAQASDPAGQHGGGGQTFAFDITPIYHRLADGGQVDPAKLKVSFVPVDAPDDVKVSVGRISLYFA